MYKKFLLSGLLLVVFVALLSACSIHDVSAPSGPTMHMSSSNFTDYSIKISKGQSINLIDDVSFPHTIKNGTWKGSVASTTAESGAPTYDKDFKGNDSAVVGPFTTAGTYHYYCTIHPGMNLTVVVA